MQNSNILEQTSEEIFHTLTLILARSFNVSIAFIQINDTENIFYANSAQAKKALEIWNKKNLYELITKTSEPVIIQDILADERSINNDFLSEGFNFNFFAGIPLSAQNENYVGCICLMHNETRTFTDNDKILLRHFASLVISEYEIRKAAGIRFTGYQIQINKGVTDLAASNDGLYKSNKELERFVYITSHDLQEPVRKIKTFINLLKNKIDDKKSVEKYIEKILFSAERLGDLITALLDYSRTNNLNKEFISTDLNQILKTVMQDFEIIINQRNVVIESDKLPQLPAVPIQMYQLFSNIISNSIKFSTANTVIDIRSTNASAEEIKLNNLNPSMQYSRISFCDNGIGFNQENDNIIFELFQRLNGNGDYPGTGIGLAICKRIVFNHQGAISVKSSIGHGSTFYVYLPESLSN